MPAFRAWAVVEPWLAALIIVGAAALSAAGMLIVRRRSPAGKFFKDPVPLGAVYTVAGTAYMVILAFVFFIAFESYGGAKDDAEEEATATLAMFHAAGPFGPAARAELQGDVICYGREVNFGRVARDAGGWMEFGRRGEGLDHGGVRRTDLGQRRQTGRRL